MRRKEGGRAEWEVDCHTCVSIVGCEYQFSGLRGSNPCVRAYSMKKLLRLATEFHLSAKKKEERKGKNRVKSNKN